MKQPNNATFDRTKLVWNSSFKKNWGNKFYKAQKIIDSEVLRLSEPYVPFDTGTLVRSGQINTIIGSGEIRYKTPYARKLYYSPSISFRGAPMKGAFWFERMKKAHKNQIFKKAGATF